MILLLSRLKREAEISKDPDLDLFSLLKEKDVNAEELSDISRDSVSEIYLFFDYDGHASMASDDKIKKMLQLFNEETNAGKLYISYPMCEAFRHLSHSVPFQEITVLCKENIHYKKVVAKKSDKCYQNLNKLGKDHWNIIIGEHCKKLEYLMTGSFSFPLALVSQYQVFVMQEEKHIKPKNEVAVLSGFPVLIADYYGYKELLTLIGQYEVNCQLRSIKT